MGQGHGADPTDVIDHLMKDVQRKIWETAAKHRNGKGLEGGADMTDVKKQLQRLQRRGKHQECGAMLVSVCAGTWTGERKSEVYGGEGRCSCGMPDADFHRMWEECGNKDEHVDYEESQTCWKKRSQGKTRPQHSG